MPFYLTPKQDDFNKIPELQICIAEALYDVDSIVADPGGLHQRTTNHLVNGAHAAVRPTIHTFCLGSRWHLGTKPTMLNIATGCDGAGLPGGSIWTLAQATSSSSLEDGS